jgi:hypothetical protein
MGLLLHALAEFLHLLVPVLVEVHPLQPGQQAVLGLPVAQPLECGQKDQHPLQGDVLVETPVLRQVADGILVDMLGRYAEDLHPARVGLEDIQHDADGGRLAGAIGAEQPEHLAGFDLERHVFHGARGAEGLVQMLDHYRRQGAITAPSWPTCSCACHK